MSDWLSSFMGNEKVATKNEPLSLRSVLPAVAAVYNREEGSAQQAAFARTPAKQQSQVDMSPLSPDPMVRLPPKAPHEMTDDELRQDIYVPLSARNLQNIQREQAWGQYHPPLPEERARSARQSLTQGSADQVSHIMDEHRAGAGDHRSHSSSAMEPFKPWHSVAAFSKEGLHSSLPASTSSLDRSLWHSEGQAQLVAEMRSMILCGELQVGLFNKHLKPEQKRLGLDLANRRMSILRADGSLEDSWDIDGLRCISFGIPNKILPMRVPPDKTLAFRFTLSALGSEDRYLCALFESGELCRLAAAAFSQLCEVKVTSSEHQ